MTDQFLGTWISECSCHWWIDDFVMYTWSNGPYCNSLGFCVQIPRLMIHTWFYYWGREFQCHGWLPAGHAYETSRPWKPQTLTLEWFPWADTLHMSLSSAAREKAHPVQPWTPLVPDLPGLSLYQTSWTPWCISSSCCFCSVLFIITNFSHEYNLLSNLVSLPSKITELGTWVVVRIPKYVW